VALLVGTDIGTLGAKTVVVDCEGRVHGEAFQEYDVLTPAQGWAEQWPNPWERAVYHTIREAVKATGAPTDEFQGLCISGLYGGSGIPVDKDYKPLRPCLIWADRRATQECEWVEETIGVDRIYQVTGNVVDPYYGYAKILWLKNNEPKTWEKIHRLETPNGYVIRRLTGVENIDHTSAGNLGGVYDLEKRCWSEELMEEMGIPRSFFPEEILESVEVVGELSGEAASKLGIPKGTQVCAGGIDAPISALAGGATKSGDLVAMLGTSMCNGVINREEKYSPQMINYPYALNPSKTIYSFTGISTAGFCVRWFRDQLSRDLAGLGVENPYKVLDEEAAKVAPGSEGLIFLPHMMVGERAPYWDNHLKGGLLGLTVYHTRGHLFRAVLEGVAYAMRYSIEAALETGIHLGRATLVGGGASSSLWRQILADVTGVQFNYLPESMGAPLGDAFLAGLATGNISSENQIEKWVAGMEPITPNQETRETYNKGYHNYLNALKHLKPFFSLL